MSSTTDQPGAKISVVMPVFDEAATLAAVVARVLASPLVREIVAVDDGSTDGSRAILERLAGREPRLTALRHAANRGKGAALRTGIGRCAGEIVLVQDADLEYDPADYPALVAPIERGEADVVFGSRFANGAGGPPPSIYRAGNRLITWLSNRATGLALTDVETCYKCFSRPVLQALPLEQDRFGIEIELTARVAARGLRVVEVPIRYRSRSRTEGKKIGLRDGVEALALIARYAVSTRRGRFSGSRR